MPTLDWIGKKAVVNHHREVPYRLLKCDREKSFGDPESGNLLVQGDNLEALKALLPYYAGKVKCIYIDPPFNTGAEDWIYNDNVSSPEMRDWLGKHVQSEGQDLSRHDKWLCMLYPRLRLLRDFLTADGTIFFHIDDNEVANALLLCDSIFGISNRMSLISFKQASATGHKSINPGCVSVMNYIIVYAANKPSWRPNRLFTGRARDKRYNGWIENLSDHHTRWRFTTLIAGYAETQKISVREARKRVREDSAELDNFVLNNAASVIQMVTPDYESVGQQTRDAIDQSLGSPDEIFCVLRDGYSSVYLKGGQRIIFYSDKVKMIDGVAVAGEPLTTLWDDLLSNNIHKEGGVEFRKGKKPETLLKRCIELSTEPGDLVMDTFAGSGTTAAAAHKMQRRYLTVEMHDHAQTHIVPRLSKVIEGEQGGISKDVNWNGGGGFRYCTLGAPLFDPEGDINEAVSFRDLAAHVFFCETGSPIPKQASPANPLIGAFQGRAIYLLYNRDSAGVASQRAGNVLNLASLSRLPQTEAGERVVYAEGCTIPPARLRAEGVVFKHIPYQIGGL